MDQILKVTNVLADPTRYHIYQFITKKHKDVTVQEMAENFSIHANVARLHLSKLEDAGLLVSESGKTGKGGRPSRHYKLSDELIQMNFPFRDFQLLARISIESMVDLGDAGKKALKETGRKFGRELLIQELNRQGKKEEDLSFDERFFMLKGAAMAAGFFPEFSMNAEKNKIYFQIYNCPFKEVAAKHPAAVCEMHFEYLEGMLGALFPSAELAETENMMNNCKSCSYYAAVTK
ncbi:helix-turn-helix domain-containing protein [Bacillus infantis]|jgi:predicted ArsR family transcriptional regulator|uniref:helix-turn-helix transcriptional regulator n=1 Tax=Bacillus infantis TaxID=324767 RepID=UPI001CD47DBE|nr:helix-turn-helix domain-containing protein [Bacillus infantis]MCA1039141.1 helix-turn-helix domain-containing protein [Bacillus infantis]MCR6611965.1 helix-turn-helix domain-containing protein [Bacillus infantis]